MRLILFFLLFISICSFAQTKNDSIELKEKIINIKSVTERNPLHASIYSAVLPGLGQAYNKKYWKIPIVWGLIGSGVGFSIYFNGRYHHYRDAFIAEINGEKHEYSGIYNKERLAFIQNDLQRNRDYAIVYTVLAYALNILDATVDAHLYEIKKDKDLTIDPTAFYNPVSGEANLGLALRINL